MALASWCGEIDWIADAFDYVDEMYEDFLNAQLKLTNILPFGSSTLTVRVTRGSGGEALFFRPATESVSDLRQCLMSYYNVKSVFLAIGETPLDETRTLLQQHWTETDTIVASF